MQIVGACPSELRGELVNKIYRKEPVCLKCSKGLVNVNGKSSSIYIEGGARQYNLYEGARLFELQ